MSAVLFRILAQHGISLPQQDNVDAADGLSALFAAGVVTPAQLAGEIARIFHYPEYSLQGWQRSRLVEGVLDEAQMCRLRCLVVDKSGRQVRIAVSDPTGVEAIRRALFGSGLSIDFVVVRDDELSAVLDGFDDSQRQLLKESGIVQAGFDEQPAAGDEGADGEDGPVARFVQNVLEDAIARSASDIHFEFYETGARVRLRIDGQLHEVARPPVGMRHQLASRIKVMARLDIAEKRVPQDGRIRVQPQVGGAAVDFRVSTLPCLFGEKVVVRLLNNRQDSLNIDGLGLEDTQKQLILDAIARPYGMILATGPTGSGKTLSLYTCLNILNTEGVNIAAVEDPAEINLPGVNQVNVNEKQGLTFDVALRAFLRQDPDIIMVGEIRDLATADIAIKAAQTGHLVFSTLHTNNAPATLTRLLNMGIAPFHIASSVNLIMAQRLVRCLCPHCKEAVARPPREVLLAEGFSDADLAGDWQAYRPRGCVHCKGKGYLGRTGLYEVMPVSERIKTLILNGGTEHDLAAAAYDEGLVDLRRAGLLKVMQGLTSLEEVAAKTNE